MHPEDYADFPRRQGFRVPDLALASKLPARYGVSATARLDDSLYVVASERVTD